MQIFNANISPKVLAYLKSKLQKNMCYDEANQMIYNYFGIIGFFESNTELSELIDVVSGVKETISEPNKIEYGDFQTNIDLANKVVKLQIERGISPHIVIEPTCGKGNFILASLQNFNEVTKIIGVEIYKPYTWECKFKVIEFYLDVPKNRKPDISIIHKNVFDFNFKDVLKENKDKEILIIGNPPWVTNSKLGSLNSNNLPLKTNFKNYNGLDAMTGKGNFDIAEYITLMMLTTFQNTNGHVALLVKNSVIKNILFDQLKNKFAIAEMRKYTIDSKKEFNVSVEASLFSYKLNAEPEFVCVEFDLYQSKPEMKFGWVENKFVSNIHTYSKYIDGTCQFEWRQGIKHDCSSIMELERVNGHFINGLKQEVALEEDLVFGFLKSSDLKYTQINEIRKYTIVTQKKVGQETNYIKYTYPKTYEYLKAHQDFFNARKSSIYKNKPQFSIFGVGDYSFRPYKVAISGLYKTFHFTLILPQNGKPVMLDDTCYMLSFDKLEFAIYALLLLNSDTITKFLQSITFADAKRTFTKDVLMRMDLLKLAKVCNKITLQQELDNANELYGLDLTLEFWSDFLMQMQPANYGQMELFSHPVPQIL